MRTAWKPSSCPSMSSRAAIAKCFVRRSAGKLTTINWRKKSTRSAIWPGRRGFSRKRRQCFYRSSARTGGHRVHFELPLLQAWFVRQPNVASDTQLYEPCRYCARAPRPPLNTFLQRPDMRPAGSSFLRSLGSSYNVSRKDATISG